MLHKHEEVHFMRLDKTTSGFPTPAYEFKPTRRRWLCNLMWKYLTKWGALKPHFEKVEKFHYSEQRKETITQHVMFAARELMRNHLSTKDYVVVMGEADLNNLVNEWRVQGRNVLLSTGPYYWQDGNIRMTLNNMPVHVVPFMKGCVLIPKMVVQKKIDSAS